jgi:hypothetical protein
MSKIIKEKAKASNRETGGLRRKSAFFEAFLLFNEKQ